MVTVEDFGRIDLRVGEVVAAEAIPRTDRLLRLSLDLGGERRTVVAGLAQQFQPAMLLGMKVIVVANLEPATIRGVVSEGMILAANCHGGGGMSLLTVGGDVANGTPVE